MGDIGSSLGGIAGDASSGLGSALGGFGQAMGGMMNAMGGGGQSAGQAYGQGGVDPNTGQPIPQETPQQVQAQSQGPPAGTTPPGTDPATQVGGTQSRPSQNQGYASVLQQLAKAAQPTPLPGARAADPAGTTEPDNQGGGTYEQPGAQDPEIAARQAGAAPGQAGGPGANASAAPYNPTAVTGYGPNAPTSYGPRLADRNYDPATNTGDLSKQYGDFLAGQGVGRPTATANLPAANAQPVSAADGGTGAGAAPRAAQGGYGQDGGGMQNIMGNLMGMFLPMILGAMMGGGGGGMGALLPMMMMGGMMGQGGLGQMFGGRRMMPGFRGGMLRPGYYPNGRGGFGFHPGGFHGGWQPHYIGGGRMGGPGTGSPQGSYAGSAGSDAAVRQRGMQGMQYLTSKGLPPASAAAILGSAAQESGVRGLPLGGDRGTSGGMFQWHNDRWARFQDWARRNGRDPSDQQANLDYMMAEMQQSYPGLWARLQQGGDPSQLADLVERVYEGASDPQNQNRERWARTFAGGYQPGSSASAPASTAPDASAGPLATVSPANINPASQWQPAGG